MRGRYSDFGLCRRLLREARPFWPHLTSIFLLSLSEVAIALLLPLPLKLVVDSVLGSHPFPRVLVAVLPGNAVASRGGMLVAATVLLIGVSLMQHFGGFVSWVLQSYTGEKLVLASRARLFHHAQRLSLGYHDQHGTADSLYRIHDDVVPTQYILVSGLVPLLSSSFILAGLLAVTALIDRNLALIALIVVPVLILLTEY